MRSAGETLPVQLAIRIVLDNVSYSNPLPDWHTPLRIDYGERERRISNRIESYLAGRSLPLPALEVMVPHRSGEFRKWVLPSVNDQIILQACVSALAGKLSSRVDPERVFSYKRNQDPNRVALTEEKLQSWFDFQKATQERLKASGGTWLLQLDLRRAFPSIDRARFYGFLDGLGPQGSEVKLIRLLLEAFAGNGSGVPLINDTVFFLGNSYLSGVDGIVHGVLREEGGEFIRFMDDYRVFATSREQLERIYERVHRGLRAHGFEPNLDKLKIGSAADYLEAVSRPDFSTRNSHYISALLGEVMDPGQVAVLVERTLKEPERYLHDGFGRFLLAVLRRFRYEKSLATEILNSVDPAEEELGQALRSKGILPLASALLERYGADPRQAWRTVWLIYLMEHMELDGEVEGLLRRIEERQETPQVVRLWAIRARQGRQREREILPEDVHDRSYLDAGLRCYGEQPCADAVS
ncbi:MAG TPA: RNA-directed DNA polymerase [Thermoanaerobaculia bacterium]|nr:RNA-directed DNA polymerase [Thermoanaerobaculia bacterium]